MHGNFSTCVADLGWRYRQWPSGPVAPCAGGAVPCAGPALPCAGPTGPTGPAVPLRRCALTVRTLGHMCTLLNRALTLVCTLSTGM